MKTLQEVFAESFQRDDLAGAKAWALRWNREWDQVVPDHDDPNDPSDCYSQRAMAGHISDYLEGFTGTEPASYSASNKNYMVTKYGSEIYWAMG